MKRPVPHRLLFRKLLTHGALSLSAMTSAVHAMVQEPSSNTSAMSIQSAQTAKSHRIIVKYNNAASTQNLVGAMAADAMQSDIQAASNVRANHLRQLATGDQLFQLDENLTAAEVDNAVQQIAQDPAVESVYIDRRVYPMFTPNDSRYNEQWHYFENTGGLRLPSAWDVSRGDGVVVGVIDTGERPHVDLVANLLPGYDMISDTQVAQDGDGRDSDPSDEGNWSSPGECSPQGSNSSWHGTHVAGTIAAQTNNGTGVAGVAFNAKIVSIRVLGRCGGFTSDVADGIIWGAGGNVPGVPVNANPAQVLNLSLGGGGPCDATTQAAIDIARSLGTTVVVAAGNESQNAANASPANCQGVITVAATNRSGGRAFYSNFGNAVDVAAPGGGQGGGVLSTINSGTRGPGADSYSTSLGTSMATPHVAGVAALMYAVNPAITPDQVEAILQNTARGFPASCSGCGAGIVDATAAVAAAGGSSGPTPIPTPTPLPSDSVLTNNVTKTNLSGSQGEELRFTIEVPAGATDLRFVLSGGSGDADLYVRRGTAPGTQSGSYDCRPWLNGNNETCEFASPAADTYHVMVQGYSAFSGVSLVASYEEGGASANTISEQSLSGGQGLWQHFKLEVPTGATRIDAAISGGTGDADLYLRLGAQPTLSSYACRPWKNGNNESCGGTPTPGTWWISIYGYRAYSGVDLEASFQ